MTPRDRDGSFTHTHGVMHLFPTGVKKVHGGMAWCLRKPWFLLPIPKIQMLTLLKSHKTDGIRMVSSSSPTGIPGLPLIRKSGLLYKFTQILGTRNRVKRGEQGWYGFE